MAKFLVFVFCFFPTILNAQVVINEIAWMGSPVERVESRQHWRYEFVELLNTTDSALPLEGWALEFHRGELDFRIPLQDQIPANGYFLIGSSDTIPGVDVNYENLSGKFVNSGQLLVLKDNLGNVVETVDGRNGWFEAGDNDRKLTMERRFPDRDASDAENWGSSITTGGTPKAENSLFQKEAVLNLDAQDFSVATKKSPRGLPFLQTIMSPVFLLALLVALASAFLILLLRRYLLSTAEGSSGGLKG